ncbi:MAG TPA: hypothetical protein DCE23_06140 [Firmicutes bacterium]|nr:hypothetical protein [Bacillota bacterium]
MTIIKLLKKILRAIINFFKIILVMIISFFKPTKKEELKNITSKKDDIKNSSNSTTKTNISTTELPNDTNNKTNPHDNESDTTDNIVFKLSKDRIDKIKEQTKHNCEIIFTTEYIIRLIEEELEHVYKDQKLEIKKADKELTKVIKKFEEKVTPIIEKQIEFYHLKKEDEVKKEVKKIVEVELKEFPILPPIDIEIKKEETPIVETPTKPEIYQSKQEVTPSPYSLVHKKKKELNLNPATPTPKIEETPIIITNDTNKAKSTLESLSTTVVKTSEQHTKESLTDIIKNTAAVATTIAIKTAEDIIKPEDKKPETKKEQRKESPKNDQSSDEKIKDIEQKLEAEPKTIEEIDEIKRDLEDELARVQEEKERQRRKKQKEEQQKQEDERKKAEDKTQQKEEKIQELVRDSDISSITIGTDKIIEDGKTEIEKEDFFDKDYDHIEDEINRMLDDITNTRLRYGNKLSSKQKSKLDREEAKLRDAKEYISSKKNEDIEYEKKQLDDYITNDELNGLQQELKRIDEQNKEKVDKKLLKRLDKLEGMTKEQVADVDKRVLFKKLNKASLLLEMGSILAFPFIRNRYFFYFTVGLIVDNHFNFVNAFWRRKLNKYEPADLSQIKQGQDALNGALDITYKNLVELDYLEQEALDRYPELINDPRFINEVTRLRTNLTSKYNKLMKKNQNMEKYYMKSKYQRKVLKRDLNPEQE